MRGLPSVWATGACSSALPACAAATRTRARQPGKICGSAFGVSLLASCCFDRRQGPSRQKGVAPQSASAHHLRTCGNKISKRLTESQALQRLKDHAAGKGGSCLAESYKNSATKVLWECEHGHAWHATPHDVLNHRSWCPECARERQSGSLKRLQHHARSKGGKCVSTEYTNNQSKYRWQCKCGYAWEATACNILNGGTWCPACARKGTPGKKRGLADLRACIFSGRPLPSHRILRYEHEGSLEV